MASTIPKRSEERMGKRTKAELERRKPAKVPGAENVTMPDPDPGWHPIAADWYLSLAESGQSRFYENSDWNTAFYAATMMSLTLTDENGPSAAMVSAIAKFASELLATEGARRRLRLELQRPGEKTDEEREASLAVIADYRKNIAG